MGPSAATYHASTSYNRHAMTSHLMDLAHPPAQSKSYAGLESIPIPRPRGLTEATTRDLLLAGPMEEATHRPLGLSDLGRILELSSTPTAAVRSSGGEHLLRSVPSAGALYPTEVYTACRGLQDLEDGLYHVDSLGHRLLRLRAGDPSPAVRPFLKESAFGEFSFCFFLTVIFFRSAWKYRSRSYRYHCLDTGHLLEGLCLALHASGLAGVVHLDFDDDRVNGFLGVDDTREAALAVVHVPVGAAQEGRPSTAPVDPPPLPPDVLKASRVSPREVDYPDVRAVHAAGKKPGGRPEEGATEIMIQRLGPETGTWSPLESSGPWPLNPPYADCVFARRSRRNFSGESMSPDALAALMESLCAPARPNPSDPVDPSAVLGTGLLIGRVQGVPLGMLFLDTRNRRVSRVGFENLTARMAHICLDQAWLAGAAVQVVFMTDLEVLDRAWSARGYRYAMLWAGRLAQRIYLAATALGLGCCGIGAFYDQEAMEALGLRGGSRLLYLVAVGPVRGGLR